MNKFVDRKVKKFKNRRGGSIFFTQNSDIYHLNNNTLPTTYKIELVGFALSNS
jgi:hypothetical protein